MNSVFKDKPVKKVEGKVEQMGLGVKALEKKNLLLVVGTKLYKWASSEKGQRSGSMSLFQPLETAVVNVMLCCRLQKDKTFPEERKIFYSGKCFLL